MEMRLLEWVKSFLESRQFNRRYVITERRDGRWICETFNSENHRIAEVILNTPEETWRVLMLLTGHGWDENTEIMERRSLKEAA